MSDIYRNMKIHVFCHCGFFFYQIMFTMNTEPDLPFPLYLHLMNTLKINHMIPHWTPQHQHWLQEYPGTPCDVEPQPFTVAEYQTKICQSHSDGGISCQAVPGSFLKAAATHFHRQYSLEICIPPSVEMEQSFSPEVSTTRQNSKINLKLKRA